MSELENVIRERDALAAIVAADDEYFLLMIATIFVRAIGQMEKDAAKVMKLEAWDRCCEARAASEQILNRKS